MADPIGPPGKSGLAVITPPQCAPCITPPMLEMLEDIVAQRCKDWGGELLDFNGEADHVHILMSLQPSARRCILSMPFVVGYPVIAPKRPMTRGARGLGLDASAGELKSNTLLRQYEVAPN
jgi:hypothetical protein